MGCTTSAPVNEDASKPSTSKQKNVKHIAAASLASSGDRQQYEDVAAAPKLGGKDALPAVGVPASPDQGIKAIPAGISSVPVAGPMPAAAPPSRAPSGNIFRSSRSFRAPTGAIPEAAPVLPPRQPTADQVAEVGLAGDVVPRESALQRQISSDRAGPGAAANRAAKERRLGYGSELIRDQLKKMTAGGQPGNNAQPGQPGDTANDQIGDSTDEDDGEVLGEDGSRIVSRIGSTLSMGSMSEIHPGLPPPKFSRTNSVVLGLKDEETQERLTAALSGSIVFRGIKKEVLGQIVDRMFRKEFRAGDRVLEQGAMPTRSDCMYYLDEGFVDIVISGGGDSAGPAGDDVKVEGNLLKIRKSPGFVLGDLALLFNSPRSASIVAVTNIKMWAMDRRTFLKFVMRFAPGARSLRFVRKLPLLKAIPDNVLLSIASRMSIEDYSDEDVLINYGERGDKLYLIRYGKVKVMRPDDKGGRIEVVQLGRGQFVGERTLITGKLRSADCVAAGNVQVVVINKKEFLDLDKRSPLLAWMLDFDAVTAVLKAGQAKSLANLPQEVMDTAIESFEREEFRAGDVIVHEGDLLNRLYVVKIGELSLSKNGVPAPPGALKEALGFSYFGETSIEADETSAYDVMVTSESAVILSLSRKALNNLLGRRDDSAGAALGLTPEDASFATSALKKSPALGGLRQAHHKMLAGACELRQYQEGEIILGAGEVLDRMYVVASGRLMLTQNKLVLEAGERRATNIKKLKGLELGPASVHGDQILLLNGPFPKTKDSLVAVLPATRVLSLSREAAEAVLKCSVASCLAQAIANPRRESALGKPPVKFGDLEMHRIIGTGQFGMVRVVRHKKSGEVYALKAMFKAPITESKQVEHIVNERRILEEATSEFCVGMVRAYQDRNCLYLLQDLVSGGELFHHLDLEGAFNEKTTLFFAANVLLALDHLHQRGIVYRDLKPENLLVDKNGYLKLADFGFAKKIGSERTYTICGTPDYQAPEVIMRRGTDKAADYWALGILIFEMLTGDPPFKSTSGDPWDTFRKALTGRFFCPDFISQTGQSLIFALLQTAPEKRLGSGPTGAEEIKQHKWFAALDWTALEEKRMPAPMVPTVTDPLDTSNFDEFDNQETPPFPGNGKDKNAHMWDLWDWIEGA